MNIWCLLLEKFPCGSPKTLIVPIRYFVGVFQCVAVPISCFTTCKTGDSQPTAMADFRTPALSSSNTCIQWTWFKTKSYFSAYILQVSAFLFKLVTQFHHPLSFFHLPLTSQFFCLKERRGFCFDQIWLRRYNTRRHHINPIVLCTIKT